MSDRTLRKRSAEISAQKEKRFTCPVCGKSLGEDNLPDAESSIQDNLYDCSNKTIIINSKVTLKHEFPHFRDEDDVALEFPHDLVAVIEAEFDRRGECVSFAIQEILPHEEVIS